MTSILTALKTRRDNRQASADRRIVDLARQAADAGERLSRLYGAIESGTVDGTDPTLKERVASLKSVRDRAREALAYARTTSTLPVEINPIAVNKYTAMMRERLVAGDVTARKAFLNAIVDAVIVSDHLANPNNRLERQPPVHDWAGGRP